MNKALLAIVLLACLCTAHAFTIESVTLFKKWKSMHRRAYSGDNEQLYRQFVFIDNLKKIREHNHKADASYTVAVNQFSDLTQEEFVYKYLMNNKEEAPQNETDVEHPTLLSAAAVATSIDWRTKGAVTPVKNQGQCGSCWSFSATGVMEGFNQIKNKVLTSFSEQQLVNCVITANGYTSYGCNGGWPQQALAYSSKYGVQTEAQSPYTATQTACTVTSTTNGYKPVSFTQVAATATGLKTALNLSPVSVLVDATNMSYYSSGVYNNCGANVTLNHAVLAVGYDASGNWIVKNSWGTSWGVSGYITIASGNTCGILQSNYYITA